MEPEPFISEDEWKGFEIVNPLGGGEEYFSGQPVDKDSWVACLGFWSEPFAPERGYPVYFSTVSDCLLWIRWVVLPYACNGLDTFIAGEAELYGVFQEIADQIDAAIRDNTQTSEAILRTAYGKLGSEPNDCSFHIRVLCSIHEYLAEAGTVSQWRTLLDNDTIQMENGRFIMSDEIWEKLSDYLWEVLPDCDSYLPQDEDSVEGNQVVEETATPIETKSVQFDKSVVIEKWVQGNFTQAVDIARAWTASEPETLDGWLMLAESLYYLKNSDEVLYALERAMQIKSSHPMFFRMVALGAIQDKAYTAAHGAVNCARLIGLPASILSDLEKVLQRDAIMSESGSFPQPENPDPRWRMLLPNLWRVRSDLVDIRWAAYGRFIFFYPAYVIEPALAFASGAGPTAWLQFPEAMEKALQLFDRSTLLTETPRQEMLLAHSTAYLAAALHLHGKFPIMTARDEARTYLSSGELINLYHGLSFYCLSENSGVASALSAVLPKTFENRIQLQGPDRQLMAALPWLVRDFPFSRLEDEHGWL